MIMHNCIATYICDHVQEETIQVTMIRIKGAHPKPHHEVVCSVPALNASLAKLNERRVLSMTSKEDWYKQLSVLSSFCNEVAGQIQHHTTSD